MSSNKLTRNAQEQRLTVSSQSLNRPRRRLEVLEEDDYCDALSFIIRRDFFPELHEAQIRAQEEAYLLEHGLVLGGGSSGATEYGSGSVRMTPQLGFSRTDSVRSGMTNLNTPTRSEVFQTPASSSLSYNARKRRRTGDARTNMNLTSFLSKYTSEDNSSFGDILEKMNEEKRRKYAWAYEKQSEINKVEQEAREKRQHLIEMVNGAAERGNVLKMIEGAEPGKPGSRLLIEAPEDERTTITGDKESLESVKLKMITGPTETNPTLLIKDDPSKKSTNAIASSSSVQPDDKDNSDLALTETLKQPEDRMETWPFKTRNSLYFSPDLDTTSKGSYLKKLGGANDQPSIQHGNTRVQDPDSSSETIPPSPSSTFIAAAIRGESGIQTPRVNGYGFVDDMPSPSPSTLGQDGMKQLMTQGTLRSAPVALKTLGSKSDEAQQYDGPFKIPATPRREALAHRMANNSARKRNNRAMGPKLRTPNRTPGSSISAREGSMTPAARRLLNLTRTPGRKQPS